MEADDDEEEGMAPRSSSAATTTKEEEQYRQFMFDDIGGLPPYSERGGMVVLQPWKPEERKIMEYYCIKKEYLAIISETEGIGAIKILHRVLSEMENASSPQKKKEMDRKHLSSIARYRKLRSILRGSRHIFPSYLNAFANHLHRCYGGDPVMYAMEHPHFCTNVASANNNNNSNNNSNNSRLLLPKLLTTTIIKKKIKIMKKKSKWKLLSIIRINY